jgi:hypothetical protein
MNVSNVYASFFKRQQMFNVHTNKGADLEWLDTEPWMPYIARGWAHVGTAVAAHLITVKLFMLRSHYLVDADSIGFRCVLWPNWELSEGYVQMIGSYFGPFWHRWASLGRRKLFNAELDAIIESASVLYRLVYRFLISLCPADIARLNTDYRGFWWLVDIDR